MKLSAAAEQLEVRTLLTSLQAFQHDINPTGDSDPENLTDVDGTLFFTADDGVHGRELWKSDGKTSELVMDIADGGVSSSPHDLVNVNGTLYFVAYDGTHALWKTDGTTTEKVDNTGGAALPGELTNVNGTLYFKAYDSTNGIELWKSDGTSTELVADINAGAGDSDPGNLTDVNGTLFFTADNGVHGRELWKYDGTDAELIEDIWGGASDSDPINLTNVDGTLFFTADDGVNGRELWKYDGTNAELLRDILDGADGSDPRQLTNVNGTLYFSADDGNIGRELWKHDDTGTELVADVFGGPVSSGPGSLTNLNGSLFFTGQKVGDGFVLWKYDGSQLEKIEGRGDSNAPAFPRRITNVNGTLYLAARDGSRWKLWESDGNTAQPIFDGAGAAPDNLTNVNGTLFFTGKDGDHGWELWALVENEAPTAVALENTISLEENTDTSAPIKVGEIVVTDDGVGTSTFGLTGTDQEFFEIIGNELFLKAGTTLDFETQDAYTVTIEVTDLDLGSGPHATTDFTLNILDVNEAPTAVTLENVVDTIEENSDTSTRIKVADIVITDDALGTNTLTLSGADAASFEIIGNELFLRSGVALDFETQTSLDVTVGVTDTDLGSGPHATTDFTLNITDVDETPPLVRLVRTIFGWKVQTVRSYVPWFFRRW